MPGETSEQIMNFILSSVKENKLDLQLLTSFCADNAPVNFGGCNQGGKNNVFYHLTERKTCLIPIGCPAHVFHNAAEKGAERLTVDIETIVLKIGSHFKSQTGRANSLKQFCEEMNTNYSTLPTHTPTRWPVMALRKGGPGAGKEKRGQYFVSQKKAAEAGFGIRKISHKKGPRLSFFFQKSWCSLKKKKKVFTSILSPFFPQIMVFSSSSI